VLALTFLSTSDILGSLFVDYDIIICDS